MKGIILLSFCFCYWATVEAQFNLPFEVDCTGGGRLVDPFLVQALKSKYPKKFSAKLDFGKDLGYDAKYKLGTAKLLARHLKNINALNYDVQNLMLQQQQQAMMQQQQQQQQQQQSLQQMIIPDQAALLTQQQQLQNIQIPLEAARSIFEQQANPQLAALSQMADQRFQQPIFQLTGAPSTPCSLPEFRAPSEDELGVVGTGRRIRGPLPGALSSVFSTCLGVLKNILK